MKPFLICYFLIGLIEGKKPGKCLNLWLAKLLRLEQIQNLWSYLLLRII
jgi:hypothetical protein